MSTAVPPPGSSNSSAAIQMRLRIARTQLREVRRTDLTKETPAAMILMIDRLAATVEGLAELLEQGTPDADDSGTS